MTDLFLDVLNTSYAATWVVLAVVLARLLLKKAPRWMVCSLWALVAARLLIGSSIVAPFSMIPSTEVIPPQSLYDQAPVIHSGVAILDNAINSVYTESLRPMPGASVNPLQIWTAVFAFIWGVGMAVLALWAIFSWNRVRRQVRESIPAESGVFLCDRIASPFIFGLFRPKIYLPSDLNTDALTHVIAHEKAHLHRRDHWWKPLGFVLLTINWFNPAMWLAYILLCRDIEMACDEKVIQDLTVEDKKAYSAALLCCSVNSRRITACPLAFGEVGVRQRVKSVLHYKKPAFWMILAAVVLITVLAAGLLTSPTEDPIQEDTWYLLTLHQGGLYSNEELTGTTADALTALLKPLAQQQMTPGPKLDRQQYSDDFDVLITIQPEESGPSYELFRTAKHGWICFIPDIESGNSDWYFDGSSLDSFLQPYEFELKLAAASFPQGPDTSLSLHFRTTGKHGVLLRAGIPILEQGDDHIHWEWEPMEDAVGFRCRPIGRQDWMEVRFYDQLEPLYHYAIHEEPILLKNGASGTLYHSGDSALWNEIVLNTTRGILRIYAPNTLTQITDWKKDDYSMAIAILETLSVTENGASMYGNTNPLGISLHLEDITPSGATLVCTQDGTLWHEIITCSNWTIQEYREGVWVNLMPEDTVWTTEAYPIPIGESRTFQLNWNQMIGSLESGQYRIGKRFTGYAKTSLHQTDRVPVDQTCYAEFIIGYYENPDDYSPELYQAIQDDWNAYDAMDPMERLYLSSTPGSCTREFDDWEALEQFVGQTIPNPLEDLDSLEKGNWAAAPEGFNGGARFHISFSGTREGQIQEVNVQSGYRRGDIRVSLNASPTGRRTQPHSAYQIISDEGDGFEARTITVHGGNIEYTLRVMGDLGTGAELTSLLQELIVYFE